MEREPNITNEPSKSYEPTTEHTNIPGTRLPTTAKTSTIKNNGRTHTQEDKNKVNIKVSLSNTRTKINKQSVIKYATTEQTTNLKTTTEKSSNMNNTNRNDNNKQTKAMQTDLKQIRYYSESTTAKYSRTIKNINT